MAGGKKRAIKPSVAEGSANCTDDPMESSECDEDSDGSDDLLDTEVTVDLEARTPDDDDYHGIQRLLQQLFLKAHINLSELTSEILKQNYVASVVTQSLNPDDDDSDDDDGSEIFGLLTVINVTEKRHLECIKQIKSLLQEKCSSEEQRKRLAALLEDGTRQVGLIVSERFTNIPPQIALPLYETLQKDMASAIERNMKYNFTDFITISKIYKSSCQNTETSRIMYANEEDSIFCEVTDYFFDYSVWEQADSVLGGHWEEDDEEWKTFRRVLVFPAARLATAVAKLQEELKSVAQKD